MINQKAIEYFGTTNNILEGGYILTNGKMLDFSGKHEGSLESNVRCIDHREIEIILESTNTNTDALIEFMNLGNIRLNPESQGLDISVMPTKEQINTIREYINYFRGEIMVDISDLTGKNIKSLSYNEKTSSIRIIDDIKNEFTL